MEFKNLTATTSFHSLLQLKPLDLKQGLNAQRIAKATINAGANLSFNWAALPLTDEHISVLQALAEEQQLITKYHELAGGAMMNSSEKRLVLHHLTRGQLLGPKQQVLADGEEKGAFYRQELAKIEQFSRQVRQGVITGSTGKKFQTVVQIGIGGSDLGPRALYLALKGWCDEQHIKQLQAYFISNVDPDDPSEILSKLDFERTLFIIVSKSGTTQETLTNWQFIIESAKQKNIVGFKLEQHMVAVTSKSSPLATSQELLASFFIDDYIGGRYSSTSAVGATLLSLAYGFEVVQALLQGAHQADLQALEPNILHNAALFDALAGLYLRNVLNLSTTAVLPYSQALRRFPAHLQQLDMESNGKEVNRFGQPLDYKTGPILFGEPGTNSQHSFYQLLHQGTEQVPLQFIGFAQSQRQNDIDVEHSTSQTKLIANLVAQIVAFAIGKESEDANQYFSGNRYSSLLFAERLTPETLGALLAHFENKVMFQGFLWNINSFDQEGVQLGKTLAHQVLSGGTENELLSAYVKLLTQHQ